MRRTLMVLMAAALALSTAFAAGCGGDDDDGGNGDPAPAAQAPAEEGSGDAGSGDGGSDPDVPSTGVEPAPPDEAKACLEEAGYLVAAGTTAIPDNVRDATGIEDQLAITSEDGGAGSITYYTSEEQAQEANRTESENQSELGQSVIGRVGTALYVFAGSETEGKAQEISSCL